MSDAGQHFGRGLRVALVFAACAVVVAVNASLLGGEFVYDDLLLVQRNPALADGRALSEALFQAHWDFVEPDMALRIGFWRPLALVALFAGKLLGGGEPFAFHALSLALHAAATAVVFALARRLTADDLIALATALLFGLHPVQVEAIGWISAVNDPLAGLLVLSGLLAYVGWRERGSTGVPIAACALFLLALLAKESAIAFVLLAPALDLVRRERFSPRSLAPLLGVVALYWLARVAVFGDAAAGFDRVTSYLHSTNAREFTLRVEMLGGSFALLAWPAQLNLFREVRPEIPWSDRELLVAAGAVLAWLVALAVAWRKQQRVALAALLVAGLAIAPAVIRHESIGRFPVSERFLYVSVFGVALLVASTLLRLVPRIPALVALGALALACAARSHARAEFWRDELTVFRGGVEASPRSIYVRWGLGRALLARFQRTSDVRMLAEAREQFEVAQDLAVEQPRDPSVLDTHFDELQASLGVGWSQLFCALRAPEVCSIEEAEAVFRGLLVRSQQSEEAHCGLGVSLRYLGRFEESAAAFEKALQANPRHAESWFNYGRLSLARQKWSDALAQFAKCVELAPDDVDAWTSLGVAAIELDLGERARQALGRARALAPLDPAPLVQLGVMAARERRFDVALDFFEQALKLDGANGTAHLLRAKALLRLGREVDAVRAFLDASRWLQEPSIDPERPQQIFEAFYNAGVLMLQLERALEALPALEEALARDPEGRWAPGLAEEVRKLRDALKSGQ